MKIVKGTYSSAVVFTTNNPATALDQYAEAQIQAICDNGVSKGSKIRVMPDVHPGKVGPIGLTMTIHDRVMPNLLGTDIGCGITMAKIEKVRPEYQKLDSLIREKIPAGAMIREKPVQEISDLRLERLHCFSALQVDKIERSIGTLGGGNHFIEVGEDEEGQKYLFIHSGSRRLGKDVTEYYLKKGQEELSKKGIHVPYELTYLEEKLMQDYIHDVEIVQQIAYLNRETMVRIIAKGMKWKLEGMGLSYPHNYINMDYPDLVLRKGAVIAKGSVVIPINMRDGVIIGEGKSNDEWNRSAPHGAGRLIKRTDIFNYYTVSDFKKEMQGIHCSCINKQTLDEAPMAYRKIDEIREVIGQTVVIKHIAKPLYNFKAGSKE